MNDAKFLVVAGRNKVSDDSTASFLPALTAPGRPDSSDFTPRWDGGVFGLWGTCSSGMTSTVIRLAQVRVQHARMGSSPEASRPKRRLAFRPVLWLAVNRHSVMIVAGFVSPFFFSSLI